MTRSVAGTPTADFRSAHHHIMAHLLSHILSPTLPYPSSATSSSSSCSPSSGTHPVAMRIAMRDGPVALSSRPSFPESRIRHLRALVGRQSSMPQIAHSYSTVSDARTAGQTFNGPLDTRPPRFPARHMVDTSGSRHTSPASLVKADRSMRGSITAMAPRAQPCPSTLFDCRRREARDDRHGRAAIVYRMTSHDAFASLCHCAFSVAKVVLVAALITHQPRYLTCCMMVLL